MPEPRSTPSSSRASRARGAAANGGPAANGAAGLAPAEEKALEAVVAALDAALEGNFSRRLSARRRDVVGDVQAKVNALLELNARLTKELARLSRVVGRDGRLAERATLPGAYGDWAAGVEAVNAMVDDLVRPTTEVGRVLDAVAQGDLSQSMALTIEGRPVRGEFARIGQTVNAMVAQLSSFADEVTRVAREVGTDGRLGGQARVKGVSGTWRDLTDSVNVMAANLTDQVRQIAQVTEAVAAGDLDQRVTVEAKGEVAALADTINSMTATLRTFAEQVTGVAHSVGTEGMLGGQAEVPGAAGTWRDLTVSVNSMADNLTRQVRNIAEVTSAVARGDLSRQITVDARGEISELKDTINTMVAQLRSFADEVTRVAREVGTEGRLGGQAQVDDVSGTWRALTEGVNSMADNLTRQVRNIAQVTTAVAQGDLTQTITVEAQGEILELKETVNTMVAQLRSFSSEVTRVAREVGTEGQLGGQAEVEGVAGTWRALTESVNQLASNLTTQVRAIASVAVAVTEGDLTQQIDVEASGEVAELSDRVNVMIDNLRDTTRRNAEQDWLKTHLARISGLMQGQRDVAAVSRMLMSEVSPLVDAQHGAFFLADHRDPDAPVLRLVASYGYKRRKALATEFGWGEGLPGQAAADGRRILVADTPPDYVKVTSGLGEASPVSLVVLPVLFEDTTLAVIEFASLTRYSEVDLALLEQLAGTIGVVLSTIQANNRTEELLDEQRRLAQELGAQSEELQSQQEELKRSNTELEDQARSLRASEELLQTQQEELRQTNEELQEKAALLAQQNRDIEIKNAEIESARVILEERAEQLALSSRYKSEFLANMSHELRTPLNSLLILSKLLADNPDANLTEQQIEFARTINAAGTDLLTLISDILDLSKVEAGKMEIRPGPLDLAATAAAVERSFAPMARERGLDFAVRVDPAAPAVVSDEHRVGQVLRNLVANALKFTPQGSVELAVTAADERDEHGHPLVLAFTVSDTGIGIPEEKLNLIFEAFQQADGTTSRRYGGTGLGLSISREIAALLGGEIRVSSTPGEGSRFTLLLPATLAARPDPDPAPPAAAEPALPPAPRRSAPPADLPDDRDSIAPDDRVALVLVEDAGVATDAMGTARGAGFKALAALTAPTGAALAAEHRPDVVLLGGGAPALEQLKHDPRTRHIPVVVLAGEEARHDLLTRGAAIVCPEASALGDALREAADLGGRRTRRVLVVDDDATEARSIAALIGGDDVAVETSGSSEDALARLDEERFDCIVLDLKLPKASGFSLLERVKADERHRDTPVIIHTGRALTRAEETRLKRYAESIVIKDAGSPERLLDETMLALHRPAELLGTEGRRMLEQMRDADRALAGRKVLIADDDVRNVFALTSALEAHGMEVVYAENGVEALARLDEHPDVALVLMDIMMPELDGYEATRAIRERPELDGVPIIALTAKAMKGDREKTIAAGASDYITKPVDVDQLVSLMRVWLYR